MKDIKEVLKRQKEFYDAGKTRDVAFRISQLSKLKKQLVEKEDDLFAALKADFSKSSFESYTSEIALVKSGISEYEKKLKRWAKDKSVPRTLATFHAKGKIRYEPFGQTLIMSPWNYPVQLTLGPLIGALAAGNTAVLKPSRYVPHTVGVMKDIIESIFDDNYVALFEGGRQVNQELLAEKFDFIFFTGGKTVGKIVMHAAAENLIPVVLELGGKSPAIVDASADIKMAAKSLCWGKFTNAGQTCVAPDYVMVHSTVKDELIGEMKKVLKEFYGDNPQNSPDFPRIITKKQFDKVASLIDENEIAIGGEVNPQERYIAPTILDNPSWEHAVMQDEIFGPILSVISYEATEEMIVRIKSYKTPLAFYIFSSDKKRIEEYLRKIPSGDAVVNDTLVHFANHHLPFGGQGDSGMGAYHGKHSFETFSHKRSIMIRSRFLDNPLRYPPYKGKLKFIKKIL